MGDYTILVVDDEEAARWGLAKLLRRDGFPTDEAADGRAALELLGTRSYSLVITDQDVRWSGRFMKE